MKKTLTILLVALMILSGVLSRAAVAEGEKNPEEYGFKTLGDVLECESPASTCYDNLYVHIFEKDGVFYRAEADITSEIFDALFEIDFFDPDKDVKTKALLGDLPIKTIYVLSDALLSDAELKQLKGKTGQELLDMGFEYGMGYSFWDDTQFYMNNGLFSYTVYMNEKVPEREDYDAVLDELFRPMTVQKVEVDGIADIASDIDLLW